MEKTSLGACMECFISGSIRTVAICGGSNMTKSGHCSVPVKKYGFLH